MSNLPFVNSYDVVGYTHADGYCLCPAHATDKDGNEMEGVNPIFAEDETESDLICDVCYSKIMKDGGDVRNAVILEANIGTEEEDKND